MLAAHSTIRNFAIACCFLACAGLTGCSSGGQAKESGRAVSTLNDMTRNVSKAKDDVNRVTSSLDQLSSSTNLKRTFDDYNRSLGELKKAAADARKRGEDLRARRDAYLARWEKEVSETSNPELRQSMEQRRAHVRENYNDITNAADEARDAYGPFIKQAEEIQKALSLDLTPAGVRSMQPVIAQAQRDGLMLSQKLDALNNELYESIGRMSPKAK